MLSGIELSGEADRGALSPFVSAGFVWAVQQSVYAGNRSRDVTSTSLGGAVNDVCHFLLSKVRKVDERHYGIFGTMLFLFSCVLFIFTFLFFVVE